jgi:ribosome-binding factor A
MDPARARKLADRIQRIVAEMLERRIKDPRLGFVTVTDARLTNDLRDATVYYTVYGTDGERADTAAALESAKGVIRSEVGRQTGLRHTPSLAFVPDGLPDNVRHVDELLARAKERDEQVAKTAEGARPAGEANPYRDPTPNQVAESDGDVEGDAGYSGG